jgi:hypothetical protein
VKRLVVGALVALGCHPTGGKGPATAASAGVEAGCVQTGPHAKVLLVHWTQAQEEELHQAMNRGLAVVAAGCEGIKLLPRCSIRGLYQYFGTAPMAQKLDLEPVELATNLSFGLRGTIATNDGFRVETVRIGRLATGRRKAERSDLVGPCEGATHFVRNVSVGLFGLGARADGPTPGWVRADDEKPNPTACAHAKPEDPSPARGCRQFLRAELTALGAAEVDARNAAITFCPPGWAYGEGKCVLRNGPSVHECTDDPVDCAHQCERGSAASCNRLGFLYANGKAGLSKDEVRGALLYKRACDGGVAVGCSNLGVLLAEKGAPEQQLTQAAVLFERGCQSGHPASCTNLAISFLQGEGVAADRSRALLLFAHACSGGDRTGCFNAGTLLEADERQGSGGQALLMFTLACDGGEPAGCFAAGELVGQDGGKAREQRDLFEQACRGGYAKACQALGQSD